MIAMQKTIVCTSNDVFALFDITNFRIRLGRPDLQRASDVAAGVCMTKFFDQIDDSGEDGVVDDYVSGLNQFMQSSGQLRGTIKAGGSSSRLASAATRVLNLGTSSLSRVTSAIPGSKAKPIFNQLKNGDMVKKIANVMGKIQLTAPVHAIDAVLTYLMGVVSGLEDMAQVRSPSSSSISSSFPLLLLRPLASST